MELEKSIRSTSRVEQVGKNVTGGKLTKGPL